MTARSRRARRSACVLLCAGALAAMAYAAADEYAEARAAMVQRLRKSGIREARVLEAMGKVPRHAFVARENRASAYQDTEVGSDQGEVVLSPQAAALMLQALSPPKKGRVLEVGVRSGYETALLAELSDQVFALEGNRKVADAAKQRLTGLGYKRVQVQVGKGLGGCSETAPFDAILVTFPVERLPQTLLEQVGEGGRLVFALGAGPEQTLNRVERVDGRVRSEIVATARMLPASEVGKPNQPK